MAIKIETVVDMFGNIVWVDEDRNIPMTEIIVTEE